MEWIEFSADLVFRLPVPTAFVWDQLVDPQHMPGNRKSVNIAVTAGGTVGTDGHIYITESEREDGSTLLTKTKVLKAVTAETWATHTEVFGWTTGQLYVLTPLHGGIWTEIQFHGMYRELIRADRPGDVTTHRDFRVGQMAELEAAAAEYFTTAVIEAFHSRDVGAPAAS